MDARQGALNSSGGLKRGERKYTKEDRRRVLELYRKYGSLKLIEKLTGISGNTFKEWIYSADELRSVKKRRRRYYNRNTRIMALKLFKKYGTIRKVANKLGVSGDAVRAWIRGGKSREEWYKSIAGDFKPTPSPSSHLYLGLEEAPKVQSTLVREM